MCNPAISHFECDKFCKIGRFLQIKNGVCKDDLILTSEHETLNTTKPAPIIDKTGFSIDTILFLILCLFLLVVISINCYFFNRKRGIKIKIYYHISKLTIIIRLFIYELYY